MSAVNRQILLKSRPEGAIAESNFQFNEAPIPEPSEGEVLVRNDFLSLDPAIRIWMTPVRTYADPIEIGDVMRGFSAGHVVTSRHPDFAEGDRVSGLLGWQDYAAVEGKFLEKATHDLPLSASLGVLGLNGRTAYFGLLDVGELKEGDTVVVSGAAGAVGSIVGQIAKIKGCRAVGTAGSDAKCRWLTEELGFDAAINYKTADVFEELSRHCPDGINVFFDNVGGPVLDTVLRLIAPRARIVICGAISTYNDTKPSPGPVNYRALLIKRARMEGFIVMDYVEEVPEATKQLAQWVTEGKIVYAEDIVAGLKQAPKVINRLFDGSNKGKLLISLAEE
jgi:NADPH-dependent curcumin reductase